MVVATIRRPERSQASRRVVPRRPQRDMQQMAYETLARHCHFRGRADGFQIVQRDDVLIVRGFVPSFYLKQVLQTALKEVEGVRWIDNQVDVVSSCGLSSCPDG